MMLLLKFPEHITALFTAHFTTHFTDTIREISKGRNSISKKLLVYLHVCNMYPASKKKKHGNISDCRFCNSLPPGIVSNKEFSTSSYNTFVVVNCYNFKTELYYAHIIISSSRHCCTVHEILKDFKEFNIFFGHNH